MTILALGKLSLVINRIHGLMLIAGDEILKTHESYQNGGWHRAVITKNETTIGLFVDERAWWSPCKDISVTGNISLGGDQHGVLFSGEIDELSIWGRAKTTNEIRGSHGLVYSGFESELLGYYRFNNKSITASGFLVSEASESPILFSPSEMFQDSSPIYIPSTLEIGNSADIKVGFAPFVPVFCMGVCRWQEAFSMEKESTPLRRNVFSNSRRGMMLQYSLVLSFKMLQLFL